jgi:hypothetical protein
VHSNFVNKLGDLLDRQGVVEVFCSQRVDGKNTLGSKVKALSYFLLRYHPFPCLRVKRIQENLKAIKCRSNTSSKRVSHFVSNDTLSFRLFLLIRIRANVIGEQ